MESKIPEDYKIAVRQCPMTIKDGPASDPRKIVELDWRNVLGQPDVPIASCSFLLGFDPRLNPPAWVDEQLQYAPPPIWATSELYIQALEEIVKKTVAQPK